jgi:1-acyl-sn-glycerol-3-phosphate acyltransferase
LCANHTSHLDPLLIACVLPLSVVTRLFFLGYSEYFSSGRLVWLWRLLRVVPIDSDRNARSGLRLAVEGLRRDLIAVVFPEASRSAHGTLQSFQGGLGVVADELKIPVMPVAIIGSYQVWPRGSRRIRIQPVEIRFGELIRPMSGRDLIADLHASVQALVRQR